MWYNCKTVTFLLMLWSAVTGTAQRLVFSQPHGFQEEPFQVRVNWEDDAPMEEETVRYTLDGSEPTAKSAVFPKSLRVSGTTILRATAFSGEERLTPVTTATYLFADDVLAQTNCPEGYPAEWGHYCQMSGTAIADYEMDPEMTEDPELAAKIKAGLTAIPTLSIVTDKDYFFNHENDSVRGGIYIYTGTPVGDGTGRGWERSVSMELFGSTKGDANGEGESTAYDLTVDCGVKLHGGHSRLPEKTPKHSLRLMFKSEFGPNKLNYPIFGSRGAKKFNQLVLRCAFGNTWVHWDNTQRRRAQYERDMWSRAIQGLMGHPHSRGLYVHLYINGLYWGLYNVAERIDDYYCSSNFGGSKAQYDVIKVEEDHSGHSIEASDGTLEAWNAMKDQITKAATSNEDYFQLIGADSYGNITEDGERLLDVDNFIDFMLINQYAGNTDWDHHNWLAFRNRERADQGFRFICWDSEVIFSSRSENVLGLNNSGAPSSFLTKLVNNPNFLHRYMDRAYRHLSAPDGWLTPGRVAAVWDSLYNIISLPIYDEAARWGDYRRDVHPYQSQGDLYTVDQHYQSERQRLTSQYFPERTDKFVQQLKDKGWYSSVEPPQVRINGKDNDSISVLKFGDWLGFKFTANIYYTINGTNPVVWESATNGKTTPSTRRFTVQNILEDYEWNSGEPLILRAVCRNGTEWSPVIERVFTIDNSTDIADTPTPSRHEENVQETFYDLTGRSISETASPAKGVYIVKGKKYLVK